MHVYRSAYLRALEPEAVLHEDQPLLTRRWSELEYQALWYSSAFGTSFRATNGSLVEIIQFGFWNREPGPDFVNAVILVDGTHELKGDIELDLTLTDWDHHGHGENPAFASVILHLFLQKGGADFFTRTLDHREIVQVQLPATGYSLAVPSRLSETRRLLRATCQSASP